ncbi:bifunctional Ulp1 protease family [Babesia duncani]|uniref:Bifunctional Ulp1 protease family n=1 Tax=Babesia duncani TaxID=323732 RepID=A0AAD9PP90_9APIC|nr:bifunctional Ulp1 protease family [Babesia duncani]
MKDPNLDNEEFQVSNVMKLFENKFNDRENNIYSFFSTNDYSNRRCKRHCNKSGVSFKTVKYKTGLYKKILKKLFRTRDDNTRPCWLLNANERVNATTTFRCITKLDTEENQVHDSWLCESCGGRIEVFGDVHCLNCQNSGATKTKWNRYFDFIIHRNVYKQKFKARQRGNLTKLALRRGKSYLWLKYKNFNHSCYNKLRMCYRGIILAIQQFNFKKMVVNTLLGPLRRYLMGGESESDVESVFYDGQSDGTIDGTEFSNFKNGNESHNEENDEEALSEASSNSWDDASTMAQDIKTPKNAAESLDSCLKFMSITDKRDRFSRAYDLINYHKSKEQHVESKLALETSAKICDALSNEDNDYYDIWGLENPRPTEYLEVLFPNKTEKYNSLDDIDEYQDIVAVIKHGRSSEVLADQFGIMITRSSISCLYGPNWLNDEVINFYMLMIQKRNDYFLEHKIKNVPNCFCFNTFFFSTLCGLDRPKVKYNFKAVARWTLRKNVNVFEKDILLIPVHLNKAHWALGVVEMRPRWRRILLFDSLGGKCVTWFANIKKWLHDEHMDKLKKPIDVDEWICNDDSEACKFAPLQHNGHDCGVFLCQYAECIAAGREFDFTQREISKIRIKMAQQIISGTIYDP